MANTTWVARTSWRAPSGSRAADTDTPPRFDDEVHGEPLLEDRGRAPPHRRDQRPLDLGPGGRAPGVQDARRGVPTFSSQREITTGLPVEHRAEPDELVDTTRALVDEHPHRVDIAQPRPRRQRVGQVQVGGVLVAAHRGGDPALGPARRRLGQISLGEHSDPQSRRRGHPDHGGEAGHPDPRTRTSSCTGRAPERGPGAGLSP